MTTMGDQTLIIYISHSGMMMLLIFKKNINAHNSYSYTYLLPLFPFTFLKQGIVDTNAIVKNPWLASHTGCGLNH